MGKFQPKKWQDPLKIPRVPHREKKGDSRGIVFKTNFGKHRENIG